MSEVAGTAAPCITLSIRARVSIPYARACLTLTSSNSGFFSCRLIWVLPSSVSYRRHLAGILNGRHIPNVQHRSGIHLSAYSLKCEGIAVRHDFHISLSTRGTVPK